IVGVLNIMILRVLLAVLPRYGERSATTLILAERSVVPLNGFHSDKILACSRCDSGTLVLNLCLRLSDFLSSGKTEGIQSGRQSANSAQQNLISSTPDSLHVSFLSAQGKLTRRNLIPLGYFGA